MPGSMTGDIQELLKLAEEIAQANAEGKALGLNAEKPDHRQAEKRKCQGWDEAIGKAAPDL